MCNCLTGVQLGTNYVRLSSHLHWSLRGRPHWVFCACIGCVSALNTRVINAETRPVHAQDTLCGRSLSHKLSLLIVRKAQLQHYSSSQNRHHNGPLHKGIGPPGATRVRCTTDLARSSFFAPYEGIEKVNECCRCEQNRRCFFSSF